MYDSVRILELIEVNIDDQKCANIWNANLKPTVTKHFQKRDNISITTLCQHAVPLLHEKWKITKKIPGMTSPAWTSERRIQQKMYGIQLN